VSRSFQSAEALASWLARYWDVSTAVVATGDVVHCGTAYGSEGDNASAAALSARFRRSLERLFIQALTNRDLEAAYRQSLHVLKSDQREILPVLAYLLGEGASANPLSYELSDYAPIFGVPAPCLVASALIEYKGRGPSRPGKRGSG